MKTAFQLSMDFLSLKGLRGKERWDALKQVRNGISAIEKSAVADPGFPLTEVRAAIGLLGKVEDIYKRMAPRAQENGWV